MRLSKLFHEHSMVAWFACCGLMFSADSTPAVWFGMAGLVWGFVSNVIGYVLRGRELDRLSREDR